MASQKNRKKELKLGLKRQGIIGQENPKVVTIDNNADVTSLQKDSATVSISEK
ncbi:hypothetical protein HMPREF9318_01368 [Streptococcus urinalis FB127-CNA-2]|uniref:Uncharacterized protein n=1 Tax=Streptococcus urinalis 2285-97 TaxID=764291 RepID=G5KD29_9STRE|nr:hypothetical protein [Streptococcus urinalis]EHJ55683.1 hypothetical protein STRUR_0548 [Streptococcus urinalis 2285-97]EKS19292.1 hypothetical protein HMPREF9318_01368 [Streptococcus urinalis FB127-CNA-2]VEF31423.1 Uncharacterised protein [Streptococcus urinalis]